MNKRSFLGCLLGCLTLLATTASANSTSYDTIVGTWKMSTADANELAKDMSDIRLYQSLSISQVTSDESDILRLTLSNSTPDNTPYTIRASKKDNTIQALLYRDITTLLGRIEETKLQLEVQPGEAPKLFLHLIIDFQPIDEFGKPINNTEPSTNKTVELKKQ